MAQGVGVQIPPLAIFDKTGFPRTRQVLTELLVSLLASSCSEQGGPHALCLRGLAPVNLATRSIDQRIGHI